MLQPVSCEKFHKECSQTANSDGNGWEGQPPKPALKINSKKQDENVKFGLHKKSSSFHHK